VNVVVVLTWIPVVGTLLLFVNDVISLDFHWPLASGFFCFFFDWGRIRWVFFPNTFSFLSSSNGSTRMKSPQALLIVGIGG